MSELAPIYRRFIPPPPPKNKITATRELINLLPNELKMKIYKEYLEPEIYYSIYQDAIKNIESKKLKICVLRPIIPMLLSKPIAVQYICKKCYYFRTVYDKHKTKNEKYFENLRNGDSFALSILMHIYH